MERAGNIDFALRTPTTETKSGRNLFARSLIDPLYLSGELFICSMWFWASDGEHRT
jgi:hypothetical protein